MKCAKCEKDVHDKGTLFPDCVCGEPLGCFRCRGAVLSVACRECHRVVNLWEHWRSISRPFKVGKYDTPGLVRFTPNGMPFICEGDGYFRACRIDRSPTRRQLKTNQVGAYLDANGEPLFLEEWEALPAEELAKIKTA